MFKLQIYKFKFICHVDFIQILLGSLLRIYALLTVVHANQNIFIFLSILDSVISSHHSFPLVVMYFWPSIFFFTLVHPKAFVSARKGTSNPFRIARRGDTRQCDQHVHIHPSFFITVYNNHAIQISLFIHFTILNISILAESWACDEHCCARGLLSKKITLTLWN